jgi:MurNAc alpha-1-phosphate uridylyltransferase
MSKPPSRAMVLAAGRGERMRPLTDHCPKPLLSLCGRPIIDRVLDALAAFGVAEVVVNLHHLGDQLRRHLESRRQPRVVFSEEAELLETGGGVKAALPLLGKAPFFVINGDVLWVDSVVPALARLAKHWDGARMDGLLLVHPTPTAFGYHGSGDFQLSQLGELRRRQEWQVAPFVYAGVQLVHPRLFKATPEGPFSCNLPWDRALEAERLYGLRHDGAWYHLGTPEALAEAEAALDYEFRWTARPESDGG